ncbi:MAG: Uma2 family endonuclease [Planctomycetota bacterium]
MTTATTTPPAAPPASGPTKAHRYKLAEDFLAEVGDVPIERIVFDPAPGTATHEQCIEFNERKEIGLAELVNGTLILKAMGRFESAVASVLIRLVGNWQADNLPGTVTGSDGMQRMDGGNVRMPDVAFYPRSQYVDGQFPRHKVGHADELMLLAVEVLSESNTPREIDMKLREYFATGTKLAWVIDPRTQTVRVYDKPDKPDTFRQIDRTDTLDGGEVLPNFSIPVAKIFDV